MHFLISLLSKRACEHLWVILSIRVRQLISLEPTKACVRCDPEQNTKPSGYILHAIAVSPAGREVTIRGICWRECYNGTEEILIAAAGFWVLPVTSLTSSWFVGPQPSDSTRGSLRESEQHFSGPICTKWHWNMRSRHMVKNTPHQSRFPTTTEVRTFPYTCQEGLHMT